MLMEKNFQQMADVKTVQVIINNKQKRKRLDYRRTDFAVFDSDKGNTARSFTRADVDLSYGENGEIR